MTASSLMINYFLVAMLLQHCKRQVAMSQMIHDVYGVSNLQATYAKSPHTISLDDIEPDPKIPAHLQESDLEDLKRKKKKKEKRGR